MTSAAESFRHDLAARLAGALGSGYVFNKSRGELFVEAGVGNNVLLIAGSSQYSPNITVSFYFGRNYSAVRTLEELTGERGSHYHIHQYSLNRKLMTGLRYRGPHTWNVDIRRPDDSLVEQLLIAVNAMAFPFFNRFSEIESARDAIASNDAWCLGGPIFWRNLLYLDAALGDMQHFENWAVNLDTFRRAQATEISAKIAHVLTRVA